MAKKQFHGDEVSIENNYFESYKDLSEEDLKKYKVEVVEVFGNDDQESCYKFQEMLMEKYIFSVNKYENILNIIQNKNINFTKGTPTSYLNQILIYYSRIRKSYYTLLKQYKLPGLRRLLLNEMVKLTTEFPTLLNIYFIELSRLNQIVKDNIKDDEYYIIEYYNMLKMKHIRIYNELCLAKNNKIDIICDYGGEGIDIVEKIIDKLNKELQKNLSKIRKVETDLNMKKRWDYIIDPEDFD